jgi:hypothetical protein
MADLFTFPEMPRERDKIPLFRTQPPGDRTQAAAALAAKFGLTGEVRDAGSSFMASDRRGSLEVFHASDSLRWSTLHLQKSEDEKIAALPDDKAAIKIAGEFLKERGISLANAKIKNVTRSELSRLQPRAKEPEVKTVAVHVNYGYALEGLPVLGPGAKMQVTIGAGSKVVECYRFWRGSKEVGERELISSQTVLELLRRDPMFRQLREGEARVAFSRVRLGYFALPPREYQRMLIPVYAFDGTISTRELERFDFVRYAVAVKFERDEVKREGIVQHEPAHLFS